MVCDKNGNRLFPYRTSFSQGIPEMCSFNIVNSYYSYRNIAIINATFQHNRIKKVIISLIDN